MSTRFVAVNWVPNQLLDLDTMNTYSNNMQNIRNEAVDGIYQHRLGGITSQGLKILCGSGGIPAKSSATADLTISFAKLFSPNSYPSVNATVVSKDIRRIFVNVMGIGRTLPNHQGFVARVTVDDVGKIEGRLRHGVYVNWIAMGY